MSTFAAIFSVRLALRGGQGSVEKAVRRVRGEYKRVLVSFLVGVETFVLSVAVLGFFKFDRLIGVLMSACAAIAFVVRHSESAATWDFFLGGLARSNISTCRSRAHADSELRRALM
jgi:hypothetical protein